MDTSTAIANVNELSRHFQKTWRERQLRRNLDPVDFDQLRGTGFNLSSDAAMAEAERKLKPSAETMNAFDHVEWTRACQEAWLARLAFEGMLRGMDDPATSSKQALLGKLNIAELAETIMLRIGRVVGGGAFSRSSPFGYWQQDVRALGYLRPPWSLAYARAFSYLTDSSF